MIIKLIALAGAALAMAAQNVPVAIGNFETATLPPLIKIDRQLPHATMTKRVEEIIKNRECTLSGQSSEKFDIVVPFAILLAVDGTAKKVVVHDTGCHPLTILVAEVVVSQAARGDFVIPEGKADQWFGSDVYFKSGEPTIGEALKDPDKVSCKSSPKLGSRLSVNRVCKTAAEWAAYETDRQQLRRDISASARCGGKESCTSD